MPCYFRERSFNGFRNWALLSRLILPAKTIVTLQIKVNNNENYKALGRTILDDDYTQTYWMSIKYFPMRGSIRWKDSRVGDTQE